MQPTQADWAAIKPIIAVAFLTLFWTWESFRPLFDGRKHRYRHAGRNVLIALLNTVVLTFVFGAITVWVARWSQQQGLGILNQASWPVAVRLLPALLLLDGWLYLWHRMNHVIPLLWRFHRMHHSDREMDVTSATRFHLGEQLGSATLRLLVIPALGVSVTEIVLYETCVIASTMFHHANISLGSWDRPLRALFVTPRMHQIHHSRIVTETNSNYSTVFSFWDRIGKSFQMRADHSAVELGLDDFEEDRWQSVSGMLKTPFVSPGEQARRPN